MKNIVFMIVAGPGILAVQFLNSFGIDTEWRGTSALTAFIMGISFWVVVIPSAIYFLNHTTFTP